MKHLRIEFIDGEIEELESRFDRLWTDDGVLRTSTSDTFPFVGASYPLVNIRKYEFVEGYL